MTKPDSKRAHEPSSLFPLVLSVCIYTDRPGIYTLSLHDALPISQDARQVAAHLMLVRHQAGGRLGEAASMRRSEEHTSELQSHSDLVCRLLLEKKKK